MITNREINEALLKRRGYKQYQGNKDNLSPLMYFFLMDASMQIFDSDVSKQECRGPQKALMTRMKDGYHFFFKDFFSAFNQDQTDYIIDKLDDYETYIKHHLHIAEIAIQECDNSKPFEFQKEMSRTWLCHLLAADAQDFHGECWLTGQRKPLYNRYIDQVLKANKEYARSRFGEGPLINEKQFKRVQDSVKIIAHKTCEWLVEDYKKEIARNGK